jgi:hypothetical protein
MKLTILFAAIVATATATAAQTFPYDLDGSRNDLAVTDFLRLFRLDDHLRYFGTDTVSVEVYFEEKTFTQYPSGSNLTYSGRCIRTVFLLATTAAGAYQCPVTRQDGTYHVIFFRGNCFVETVLDMLPDGTSSQSSSAWGGCARPRRTKRT